MDTMTIVSCIYNFVVISIENKMGLGNFKLLFKLTN